MDRRSWLWRRKSSDKSPGETESSGSMSSHSERFSDEQAFSNHNIQSPEVTSKDIPADEELNDSVKTLREKLSSALQNISSKDDLVKQHSKVAEEAVSGWEKAENEVFALKQQLESLTQRSSSLEDRTVHLDVALRECMRQLRHEREEQEQKIHEAIVKKTNEWEATKSGFQKQLVELQSQLQAAKGEGATSWHIDLRSKLEAAEKEISSLKHELLSRSEELELRTVERDLSTEAAESASRQNLESVKKVAKLETECRRLKAVARRAPSFNEQRSITESSVYVESFTDSQSDIGERLSLVDNDTHRIHELGPNDWKQNPSTSSVSESANFRNVKALGKSLTASSLDDSLMDDFLEMERLVALPDTQNVNPYQSRSIMEQSKEGNTSSRSELETMRNRIVELEDKLVMTEADKNKLETFLTKHQDQIRTLTDCLEEAEMKLMKMEADKNETEASLIKHQLMLHTVRDRLEEAEMKLVKMEVDKNEMETILIKHQHQLEQLRARSKETEIELAELQTRLAVANEARETVEAACNDINSKKETAESRLGVVDNELKAMITRIRSLEEEIQKERSFSEETISKCQKLEQEILRLKHEGEIQRAASSHTQLKQNQDKELAAAAYKFSECKKTIASLGRQLKSLATLEDFLSDSDNPCTISRGPQPNESISNTMNLTDPT
ncbi:hypothetical protein ACET3Z_001894 [Daucus carota]